MITDDTFKVGATSAIFDGIECDDVEKVLRIASEYSTSKDVVISEFQRAVETAKLDAIRKIEVLQDRVMDEMK